MNPSTAKLIYQELRAKAVDALASSDQLRSEAIGTFIDLLRNGVVAAEYPWSEFRVHKDLRLCIQYTDEKRGQALIRTIIDLIVEMLTEKTDLAILFRDETNPVFTENSPATEKVFRVFQAAGGRFVPLKLEWLADFCALIELRKVAEHGTASEGKFQAAPKISPEEFHLFLSREFHTDFVQALTESMCSPSQAERWFSGVSRVSEENVSVPESDVTAAVTTDAI